MKLYNLDTVPLTYQVGEISYYVYLNPEKIPLLTVGVVKNMPHGNFPRESWISYDAFMARYRKNTNGELFYMESRVKQAKIQYIFGSMKKYKCEIMEYLFHRKLLCSPLLQFRSEDDPQRQAVVRVFQVASQHRGNVRQPVKQRGAVQEQRRRGLRDG